MAKGEENILLLAARALCTAVQIGLQFSLELEAARVCYVLVGQHGPCVSQSGQSRARKIQVVTYFEDLLLVGLFRSV